MARREDVATAGGPLRAVAVDEDVHRLVGVEGREHRAVEEIPLGRVVVAGDLRRHVGDRTGPPYVEPLQHDGETGVDRLDGVTPSMLDLGCEPDAFAEQRSVGPRHLQIHLRVEPVAQLVREDERDPVVPARHREPGRDLVGLRRAGNTGRVGQGAQVWAGHQ